MKIIITLYQKNDKKKIQHLICSSFQTNEYFNLVKYNISYNYILLYHCEVQHHTGNTVGKLYQSNLYVWPTGKLHCTILTSYCATWQMYCTETNSKHDLLLLITMILYLKRMKWCG